MLERLNPFRRQRWVGLDLGSHSLKWAVVDSSRRELVQSGCTPLFPERQNLAQPLDWHLWESRVQKGLEAIPMEVAGLNTVVQGKSTVYGYLEFPNLSDDELRVAAQAEAQQAIPFPADTIQFSYTRVPPLRDPAGCGIFFAAALLSEVLRLRQLLARAGRTPQRVEVPALALAREFALNHEPARSEIWGVLHIGFSLTQLVVVREGFPYYARDFGLGSGHFSQALCAAHGLTFDEAEKQFYDGGLHKAPLGRLGDQVQRTLQHAAFDLKGLYLSGGGAVASLAEALQQRVGLPVLHDSWQKLKGRSEPSGLFKLAAGLAIT